MKWSYTGLMVLLSLCAAAAAWAMLAFDRDTPGRVAPQRIFAEAAWHVEDVSSVSIEREGGSTHVFEVSGDGWQQSEPFEVGVNGLAIRELIEAAADLTSSRALPIAELEDGTTLASLGLDPPLATVTLEVGSQRETFALGRRTVAGRAWLRRGASPSVLLVNDALHAIGLDQDVRTWRRRDLFRGAGAPEGITITNGAVTTVLRRSGTLWELVSPIRARADAEAIARLIAVLDRATHDGVVLDTLDRSPFGLDAPAAMVAVESKNGTERLLVGSQVGISNQARYAVVEGVPSIVRLSETTLQGVLPRLKSLLAATATGVRPADVKSIELVANDGGSVLLERSLDRWVIERTLATGETDKGEAMPAMVDELLALVCDTRAIDVVVQAFPSDLAEANVTLRGYDGAALDTIRFARETSDGRWALDDGEGVLRIFPPSTVMPIDPRRWLIK
jgi:hypothetical protein